MIAVFAILGASMVWIAFRLCEYYVSRATRSYAHAEKAWSEAMTLAHEILEKDIPLSVAQLIVATSALAGCGCFVRGLIASAYLPHTRREKSESSNSWDGAFTDLEALDSENRKLFNDFLVRIVIYDSYKNPISGKIFRSIVRSKSSNNTALRLETQLTTYSLLSRKNALNRTILKGAPKLA